MFSKIHLSVAAAALTGALGLASSGAAAQTDADADAATTQQVQARLDQNPGLRVDQIHVQTLDGVVYLHGLVDTPVEEQKAETLTRGVPSVRKVVDELEAPAE